MRENFFSDDEVTDMIRSAPAHFATSRDDIADPTGRRSKYVNYGYTRAYGWRTESQVTANTINSIAGNPIQGEAEFAPGCTHVNAAATTLGNFFWLNVGTVSAAIWVNLDGAIFNSSSAPQVITTISTVGNGTLTTASLMGGTIARTGAQTAAFTDTTDTLTLIKAATGGPVLAGQSWEVIVQNNTAYPETITGGTSVTVSGISVVPRNSWVRYLATYVSATSITLVGIAKGDLMALPPMGSGTITLGSASANFNTTAAQLVLGVVSDVVFTGNSTGTFTLTLDTTANIIAAIPNAQVGEMFRVNLANNGSVAFTTTAGDASTVFQGSTTIGSGKVRWFDFLINSVAGSGSITVTNMGSASYA